MTIKINYTKVNEHQKLLAELNILDGVTSTIAYMLCEQLIGIPEDDIRECEEIAAIEVIGDLGSTMYCKDHANAFFLTQSAMFSQTTS